MSEAGTRPRGHRDRSGPRHRRRHRAAAGPGRVRRRRPRPRRGGRPRTPSRRSRPPAAGRWPSAPTSSDAEQVEAAVDRVAAELGAPTVLVNNAGVIRDNLLFKMTDADWDTVMNVHLRGAFLMTRAVQKHMIEAEVGPDRQPVQHLGAGQPRPGQLLDRQGRPAGLHQDPRHRAGQVRRHRQRDRPRLHPDRDDQGDRRRAWASRSRTSSRRAATQIPVARVGQPEDIAHLVSFFVSEGAGLRLRPGRLRRRRPEGLRDRDARVETASGRAPRRPCPTRSCVERRGAVQVVTINRPRGAQRAGRGGRRAGGRRRRRARRLRRPAGRRAHRRGRVLLRRHGPQGVPPRGDAGDRGPRALRHHRHPAAQADDRRGRGRGAGRRLRAGARLRPRRRRAVGAVRRPRGQAVAGRRRRRGAAARRSGCRARSRWRCCSPATRSTPSGPPRWGWSTGSSTTAARSRPRSSWRRRSRPTGPLAVAATKRIVQRGAGLVAGGGRGPGRRRSSRPVFTSEDAREGVDGVRRAARAPVWKGR